MLRGYYYFETGLSNAVVGIENPNTYKWVKIHGMNLVTENDLYHWLFLKAGIICGRKGESKRYGN
jgi:hypothetical protein